MTVIVKNMKLEEIVARICGTKPQLYWTSIESMVKKDLAVAHTVILIYHKQGMWLNSFVISFDHSVSSSL